MAFNRIATALVIGIAAVSISPTAAAERTTSRVLVVVSSEGDGSGSGRPGFEMDELAQAWGILVDNGMQTVIASPRGGAVHADTYDAGDPANARLLANAATRAQLDATVRLDAVDAADYDAVLVIGGKGAMFDLAVNAVLSSLLAEIHDDGGVVAAVCHGSAALAEVRLADGRFLVDGRKVTGFSAEEEHVFGKRWADEFPFVLEEQLRARGARWMEAPLMMPNLALDERLVTGQNPYSTGLVAEAMVAALGSAPLAREPRRDEASLVLLQRAVHGDASVAATLLAAPDRYRPELIGIVGHYQLRVAQEASAIRAALIAMELAAPFMDAPELSLSRAEAHWRLGQVDAATALLDDVLARFPQMPEARALASRIDAQR